MGHFFTIIEQIIWNEPIYIFSRVSNLRCVSIFPPLNWPLVFIFYSKAVLIANQKQCNAAIYRARLVNANLQTWISQCASPSSLHTHCKMRLRNMSAIPNGNGNEWVVDTMGFVCLGEKSLAFDCKLSHFLSLIIGNPCSLCNKCFNDEDHESKTMQCGRCNRWAHAKCESLTGRYRPQNSQVEDYALFIVDSHTFHTWLCVVTCTSILTGCTVVVLMSCWKMTRPIMGRLLIRHPLISLRWNVWAAVKAAGECCLYVYQMFRLSSG